MDNEGLMIFIFQAIIALFAFFVVAPCVLNAVSLFTVQKRFAKTMIDLGVVQADVVHKLHPKKEIAGVIISAPGGGLPEIPPDRPVQQPDGEAIPEHLSGPDGREEVQRLCEQDLLSAKRGRGSAPSSFWREPPGLFTKSC